MPFNIIGKPASVTYQVPPGARAVLDRAAELLERRRGVLQVDTGRAEADAAAEAALERAEREQTDYEVATGLADAAGQVDRFDDLEIKRRAAAAAAVNARDEVDRIARRRRGAQRLAADLDKEVCLLAGDVNEAMAKIRDVVLRAWRQKLLAAVTGTITGGLLGVIREGWVLNRAIKVPRQEHLELKVFDPIGFEDDGGFGIRMVIDINRAFLGAPTGRVAERLDLSWSEIPELKALFDALSPFTRIEAEVRAIEALAADRDQRARLALPQRPQLVQQAPPAQIETDEEYEARVAADRAAAAERSAERERTAIRYVTPGRGIIAASRRGAEDPVNVPPAG
jgi:hypothetical protein